MSDEITLTLSRADAELIADLADTGLGHETSYLSMDGFTPQFRAELDRLREDGQRVIKSIYAALESAPAEGPERAATGETGDSLERAIADAEAKGYSWRISGGPKPEYRQDARIAWEWPGGAGCKDCEGKTPLEALRGALKGEGLPTNWGEKFPRKALRAAGEGSGA